MPTARSPRRRRRPPPPAAPDGSAALVAAMQGAYGTRGGPPPRGEWPLAERFAWFWEGATPEQREALLVIATAPSRRPDGPFYRWAATLRGVARRAAAGGMRPEEIWVRRSCKGRLMGYELAPAFDAFLRRRRRAHGEDGR